MTLARIITIFFFVSPSLALAQGAPKIVTLQKNQRAPFAGSLLNPAAVAKTIAEKENSAAQCKLTQEYIEEREKNKCDLAVGNARASLDALNSKHNAIVERKNDEVERLAKLAMDQPNRHNHWWALGGFVTGIATSVAIFYAAVEISR